MTVLRTVDKFLDRLFVAGDKRAHPRDPALVDWLGLGSKTASGANVTEETSLQVAAVWSCVRVLSESVASLPLLMYEDLERGRRRAKDHRLYNLLHRLPNPELTSVELRESLQGHLVLWGNGYCEKEFNNAGQIMALWPLRPDKTRPRRIDKQLKYEVTLPTGEIKYLDRERVMHIRGLSFNGITGYGPIQLAKQTIGLSMAAEEFGARFFGNGAQPGGVLEHPALLDDMAYKRIKKSWDDSHKGLANAHRIAILEEGTTYKQVGIPPDSAQYLETRKFQVSEVARIMRVPPHMVGDLDRATFSNIEQMSLEFVIYSLAPWLVKWEQAIYRDLLSPAERARFYAEHLIDGLVRGDIKTRYEAYHQARQDGWMSANDIRQKENMNPIEGGDIYWMPVNMISADEAGSPGDTGSDKRTLGTRTQGEGSSSGAPLGHPDSPPQGLPLDDLSTVEYKGIPLKDFLNEAQIREVRGGAIGLSRSRLAKNYERVIRDVAARVVRREVADVKRALSKHLTKRDETSFVDWLREFYLDHRAFWVKQMLPVLLTYADLVGADVAGELGVDAFTHDDILDFIERYAEALSIRESSSSEAQLRALLDEAVAGGEDPEVALGERLDQWAERRPEKISRHESRNGIYAFALAFYGVSRIVEKMRWVANGDSCPFCLGMNGRVVGISEVFLGVDEPFEPEGAEGPLSRRTDIRHPPLHDGCDCSIVAEIG